MPAGAVLRLAVQLGRLYALALHGPSEGPVRMTSRRRSRWLNSPAARLKRHQLAACPHGSFRESPGSFGAAPDGRLAQLVERLVYTEDVGSSSLSPPTTLSRSDCSSVRPRVFDVGEGGLSLFRPCSPALGGYRNRQLLDFTAGLDRTFRAASPVTAPHRLILANALAPGLAPSPACFPRPCLGITALRVSANGVSKCGGVAGNGRRQEAAIG